MITTASNATRNEDIQTAAMALNFAAQAEINEVIEALEQTRDALGAGENLQAIGAFSAVDMTDINALMRVLQKHARR